MMTSVGRPTYLRPCAASDDAFLYDVFCTTWASEVAALPNQNLAQHVLRIQHIAQERRFATNYPNQQRFVLVEDGEPAGRLYLQSVGDTVHVVDLTLLPRFREQGIGSRVIRDLVAQCTADGRSIRLRVSRRNRGAIDLVNRLGFSLVSVDDLENFFEWHAHEQAEPQAPVPAATEEEPAMRKEGTMRKEGSMRKESPADCG